MTGHPELQQIAAALKNADRDRDRALSFVPSRKLGISREDQPELALVQGLRDDPGARISVEGPAGSGKTSLIVHAMGHLRAFNHVSLVVRVPVGDKAVTFDKLQTVVLNEIAWMTQHATPGSRLETVGRHIDLEQLAEAITEKKTVAQPGATTAAQIGVRAGITASVTRSIHDEAVALQTATTPGARTRVLQAVLDALTKAGARLAVVIDDTESYATGNGPLSENDKSEVEGLYEAVQSLGEHQLQIVIAVHPRFRDVMRSSSVLVRSGFLAVPVATLRADQHDGLRSIIDKRLSNARINLQARDVFSPDALAQLEAIYHAGGLHDLRYVLRVAQTACRNAGRVRTGASRPRVTPSDVNAALESDQTARA